jgi:hypothetical protein
VRDKSLAKQRPVSIPPEFYRGNSDFMIGKDMGDITDLGISLQDSNLANIDQVD